MSDSMYTGGCQKRYKAALRLLQYSPLLKAYPLELYMLECLERGLGSINESQVYNYIIPSGFHTKSYDEFAELADAYDEFIEEMKYKHKLWTFIPKNVKENVLLVTDKIKKKACLSSYGTKGTWRGSKWKFDENSRLTKLQSKFKV